jgi:hypothetical protein
MTCQQHVICLGVYGTVRHESSDVPLKTTIPPLVTPPTSLMGGAHPILTHHSTTQKKQSHSTRNSSPRWPHYQTMMQPILLQCINFLGKTPQQLYQILEQADTLLLVSDGSADSGIRSTGWIIPDSLGHRFVKGSSSIPGTDPQSYRTEGYAMASGLAFL